MSWIVAFVKYLTSWTQFFELLKSKELFSYLHVWVIGERCIKLRVKHVVIDKARLHIICRSTFLHKRTFHISLQLFAVWADRQASCSCNLRLLLFCELRFLDAFPLSLALLEMFQLFKLFFERQLSRVCKLFWGQVHLILVGIWSLKWLTLITSIQRISSFDLRLGRVDTTLGSPVYIDRSWDHSTYPFPRLSTYKRIVSDSCLLLHFVKL